jgi:ketol-acid reductoisomerase
MREVLDEIQSGAFAKKWIEEARSGGPNFERRRQEERVHILETTGDALRGRMSWL